MAMLEAETFEIHDHVEATEDLLGWTSCDCSTSTGSSTSSTSTSSSTTSCTSTASCA
ncbi:lantibiotic protein [Actinomadura rudentiformis]|uniref:Lantibiotic protein n=2 Tax=Actinomadura rudentiformis TaxID=359158 RepID=A0A6H9Y7Z0_9ACTN|nr:lantibiotic protein [Actinomadura rudentiformis]